MGRQLKSCNYERQYSVQYKPLLEIVDTQIICRNDRIFKNTKGNLFKAINGKKQLVPLFCLIDLNRLARILVLISLIITKLHNQDTVKSKKMEGIWFARL